MCREQHSAAAGAYAAARRPLAIPSQRQSNVQRLHLLEIILQLPGLALFVLEPRPQGRKLGPRRGHGRFRHELVAYTAQVCRPS